MRKEEFPCKLFSIRVHSYLFVVTALLLVLRNAPAQAAPAAFVLEGARVHAAFDKQTGVLLSIRDPQSGREWLAPGGGTRLYELTLARPGQEPLRLTAAQATGMKARRSIDGIQISAETHGDVPLGVRLDFAVDPNSGLLAGRLSVRNDTGLALQAVRFPLVSLPARLGEDAADDRVLLPYCDGLEIQNPEANLRGSRTGQYPGSASMQCLAAYDAGGGFYAAAWDGAGNRKQLGMARVGETLEPVLTHYPTATVQTQWTLPYLIVLGTFSGDWQAAADLYRSWAEKQPWCRTPLAKRKEIPAWAFQPSFFYAVSLRGDLPEGGQGDRLSPLAEQITGYHQTLGAPVVAMLMSWEKHGAWIAPDYFPPFGGADRFQTLTQTLHRNGDRSLVFLSGLKWTLRKTYGGTPYEDAARFPERGEKWAIVDEAGQPQRFGKPDQDVGEHAQICPATPLARELLSDAVRGCQELGIDCVQVDQIVGGGMPPCYSKEHGHPPGGGNWSAQAVYALFDQLHREGHQRSKDFLFLMEEPGEFFIPVLDAYHARDYAEARWPRDGAGVRGVPLFTYVYHDYCLGYGGDSAPLGPWPERLAPYQHALNLVHGKIPAGAVWSRWQPAEAVHPDQITILRNAVALLNSPAGEFLLKGRRVPAPLPRTQPLMLRLGPQGAKTPEERSYPGILHAIYKLPDEREGRIYINLGKEPVRVDVPIAARGLPGQRLRLTRYQPEDGKVTTESETTLTPSMYPLLLPPLVPVLLESVHAGWEK